MRVMVRGAQVRV